MGRCSVADEQEQPNTPEDEQAAEGEAPEGAAPEDTAEDAAADAAAADEDASEAPADETSSEEEDALAAARAAIAAASGGGGDAAPATPEPVVPMGDQGTPFEAPEFEATSALGEPGELQQLNDVDLDVTIELGRTVMTVDDILRLDDGAVVELDKLAGDPVDVYVNGRHVARGEVLVLNDNFCVRVNEIIDPDAEQSARAAG